VTESQHVVLPVELHVPERRKGRSAAGRSPAVAMNR
jgi:hypothetical protein